MILFDILNNHDYSEKLIKDIDEKIQSKDFWKEDEKRYLDVRDNIIKNHKSIEMSFDRFNRSFTI